MTEVEKLAKLTGESDEELLSLLLENAEDYILTYTNRSTLIDRLRGAKLELAAAAYNKIGSEGIASHSEGGISVSFENDIPPKVLNALNVYRLGRVGGVVFEKTVT